VKYALIGNHLVSETCFSSSKNHQEGTWRWLHCF